MDENAKLRFPKTKEDYFDRMEHYCKEGKMSYEEAQHNSFLDIYGIDLSKVENPSELLKAIGDENGEY